MGVCLYLPHLLKNYQIDWKDNFLQELTLHTKLTHTYTPIFVLTFDTLVRWSILE